jgi:glucokinase-like ROK family protein
MLLTTLNEYNTKQYHKRLSLDLIRFTPGGISRAELSRQIGITRSAVTTIVNDLMSIGLVREAEDGHTASGRPPILLEINPRRGYLIGIDIGATHISTLVTDFSSNVIYEVENSFDIKVAPELGLQQVDHCLQSTLKELQLDLRAVIGIGVGVPGPVISAEGNVGSPPLMPGWDRYPIRARLEGKWGRPISLGNDAELGALGEWAHGAGRGEQNLAYIKVGTGVGAGFLLNGKIYRGATGSAGEIGHITIQENGPQCACGNYGCLEALAGGNAIARQAQQAVRSGRRTQLATIDPVESITARDVASAARRGDHVAQKIIMEAGTYLGIGIASLVNLINPGLVVIGGGVAQTGDLLLQPLRQVVQQRSLASVTQVVRISTAVLGRRSTSMGAVVQSLDRVLDQLTLA